MYVWHYIPCKQIKQFYLLFSMIKYCKTPSVQVRMARQDLQDHETTCWAFWKPDIAFLPPLVSPHKTASSAELSSADVVRIVSSIRENYFPGFAIASCNLKMQMRHPLKNFKHLWAFLIVYAFVYAFAMVIAFANSFAFPHLWTFKFPFCSLVRIVVAWSLCTSKNLDHKYFLLFIAVSLLFGEAGLVHFYEKVNCETAGDEKSMKYL